MVDWQLEAYYLTEVPETILKSVRITSNDDDIMMFSTKIS